jgi:HEAT repeat protein
MKPTFGGRWFWTVILLLAISGGAFLVLQTGTSNVMHPALGKLSAVPLHERWSQPEMLRIRALGPKALPPLRRVLREKDSPTTHFLLWVKTKWPRSTNCFARFPDLKKLTERRWTACQVLQTLGPAGRPAVPELLDILKNNNITDLNAASMALQAIGVDAEICERMDALLEAGLPEGPQLTIVILLAKLKPASPRTLKALTTALADPSPYVQKWAATALGDLGVAAPEVIAALKRRQTSSSDDLVVLSCSAAIWDLEKDAAQVLQPAFQILQKQLAAGFPPAIGGDSGQGVTGEEEKFLNAATLFQRMALGASDKAKALDLLAACCQKSGRMFMRLLLLPAMMDLGFSREESIDVCRAGLARDEVYYRLQAAQLLAQLGERSSLEGVDLNELLRDRDVGVRVYSARAHWLKNHQALKVVPVLAEALDEEKHQSYYYAEIQPAALTTLRGVGPEAKGAAAALVKASRDANPAIAKLASEALQKVREGSSPSRAFP